MLARACKGNVDFRQEVEVIKKAHFRAPPNEIYQKLVVSGLHWYLSADLREIALGQYFL